MTGDCHVRICEGLGVKFPWATRLAKLYYQPPPKLPKRKFRLVLPEKVIPRPSFQLRFQSEMKQSAAELSHIL